MRTLANDERPGWIPTRTALTGLAFRLDLAPTQGSLFACRTFASARACIFPGLARLLTCLSDVCAHTQGPCISGRRHLGPSWSDATSQPGMVGGRMYVGQDYCQKTSTDRQQAQKRCGCCQSFVCVRRKNGHRSSCRRFCTNDTSRHKRRHEGCASAQ